MRHFNMADFLRGQASRILTSVSETDDTGFVCKHGKSDNLAFAVVACVFDCLLLVLIRIQESAIISSRRYFSDSLYDD